MCEPDGSGRACDNSVNWDTQQLRDAVQFYEYTTIRITWIIYTIKNLKLLHLDSITHIIL